VDRRAFVAGTLGFLAAPLAGEAQQAGRIYRIGVLSGASSPLPVDHPAFLKALRELGYVPGQNLILEERYAGGTDRLPALAAELAGLNVDVMVTIGTPAARAAKAATDDPRGLHYPGRSRRSRVGRELGTSRWKPHRSRRPSRA
jgi:putative tryptophan/tyrosine transport system substrate-binding protein